MLVQKGEYDQACEYYRRALAIDEKALGPHHPVVGASLGNLGTVFLHKGEFDKALEHKRRSLAIREKALGPEHPDVAWSLAGVGVVQVRQGQFLQALKPLSRAVGICQRRTCDAALHGNALFALAQALVMADQETERAIRLAKQARAAFRKGSNALKKELEGVDAWLEERGVK